MANRFKLIKILLMIYKISRKVNKLYKSIYIYSDKKQKKKNLEVFKKAPTLKKKMTDLKAINSIQIENKNSLLSRQSI